MPKLFVNDLTGGYNRQYPPHLIQETDLYVNDDTTYRAGKWQKRQGFTLDSAAGSNPVTELTDYIRNDGSSFRIAATTSNLYYYNAGWVSRLTLGSSIPTSSKWFFAEKNNSLYACNPSVNDIYVLTNPTSGNFTAVTWNVAVDADGVVGRDLISARCVLPSSERLIFGGVNDSIDGLVGNTILYTKASTYDRIDLDNDIQIDESQTRIETMSYVGRGLIAVYKQDMIALLQQTGVPVLSKRLAEPVGILNSKARTPMPDGDFFVSQSGFYLFSGGGVIEFPNENMTNFFFENVNPLFTNFVYCFTDWRFREINILYPSLSSADGRCDKRLVYNWQYNNWTLSNTQAYCGFTRYRENQQQIIYYGDAGGVVKIQNSGWGVNAGTDNGTAITPKIRTKSFYNQASREIPEPEDYISLIRITTDADGAAVGKTAIHDTGGQTPVEATHPLSVKAGRATRFTDTNYPRAARYFQVGADGFNSVSEFMIKWESSGDE